MHARSWVSPALGRPREADPQGSMVRLPRQIGEFQTNDRPCIKRIRWVAGVTQLFSVLHVSAHMHALTYTCTCTHVYLQVYTYVHLPAYMCTYSAIPQHTKPNMFESVILTGYRSPSVATHLVQDANTSSVASIVDSWEEPNMLWYTELDGFCDFNGAFTTVSPEDEWESRHARKGLTGNLKSGHISYRNQNKW